MVFDYAEALSTYLCTLCANVITSLQRSLVDVGPGKALSGRFFGGYEPMAAFNKGHPPAANNPASSKISNEFKNQSGDCQGLWQPAPAVQAPGVGGPPPVKKV